MAGPAPSPAPARRSKRIYILWATALTLLLTAATFCWLVVVPVMEVRAATKEYRRKSKGLAPDERQALAARLVERLGGQARASRKIVIFLNAPAGQSGRERYGAALLAACGESGLPKLSRLMQHDNPGVRMETAREIMFARTAEVVPLLIAALEDEEALAAGYAMKSLCALGPEVVEPIGEALPQLNARGRARAVTVLGRVGDVRAVNVLSRYLSDEDAWVRTDASTALKKIKAAQEKK